MHNGIVIHRAPLLTIALCLSLLSLWLIAPADSALFGQLILDKSNTLQWWRAISGHAIHTSLSHLAWNVGALALLGSAIEVHSRSRLLQSLLAGGAAVSVWFFWQDTFSQYAGASGVLNTLLIAALYCQRGRLSNKITILIGLVATLKVIIELMTTLTLTSLTSDAGPDASWPPATGAHAAGLIAGIAIALIWPSQAALAERSNPGPSKH